MINGIVKSDKPTERQEQRKGSALAFLGWTFAVLSLLWFPVVTSPIAVILGFLTKKVEGRDIQRACNYDRCYCLWRARGVGRIVCGRTQRVIKKDSGTKYIHSY